MAMNPELKKKWVAALRSGKYKQGKHVLNGHNGMCCLGVLCEVMNVPHYTNETQDEEYRFDTNDRSSTFIPDAVLATVGITHKEACTLAGYNDMGRSFAYIASNIERRKRL